MPGEAAAASAALLISRERRPGMRLCLAHAGGALPAVLPPLDRGELLVGRAGERLPTVRARDLWCDSLAYDADSLRRAVARFGPGHVVLGTGYPFAALETPAWPASTASTTTCADPIGRDNALDMIAAIYRDSAVHDTGGPSWARSSASA